MASGISQFFAELKRRKVTRVAVVYALVGIAIIEGAQLIFEALELPQVAWQILTILVLLGFPVALVLAWAVDLTPTGIERTSSSVEVEEGALPDGRTTLAPGYRVSLAPWALCGAALLQPEWGG